MGTTYQTVQVEGASFPSSNFAQLLFRQGTNFPVFGLAFDAATNEKAYFKFRARKYGSGNITCKVSWYGDSATSGDVKFGVRIAAITPDSDNGSVEAKAFATQNTQTDTHLGTTAKREMEFSVTISNLDSIAEGDNVWLELERLASDGSDTMTGDAIVTGIELSYSDT